MCVPIEFYARQLDDSEGVALSAMQEPRAPAAQREATSPRVRKDFPETWLWEELDLG